MQTCFHWTYSDSYSDADGYGTQFDTHKVFFKLIFIVTLHWNDHWNWSQLSLSAYYRNRNRNMNWHRSQAVETHHHCSVQLWPCLLRALHVSCILMSVLTRVIPWQWSTRRVTANVPGKSVARRVKIFTTFNLFPRVITLWLVASTRTVSVRV